MGLLDMLFPVTMAKRKIRIAYFNIMEKVIDDQSILILIKALGNASYRYVKDPTEDNKKIVQAIQEMISYEAWEKRSWYRITQRD